MCHFELLREICCDRFTWCIVLLWNEMSVSAFLFHFCCHKYGLQVTLISSQCMMISDVMCLFVSFKCTPITHGTIVHSPEVLFEYISDSSHTYSLTQCVF